MSCQYEKEKKTILRFTKWLWAPHFEQRSVDIRKIGKRERDKIKGERVRVDNDSKQTGN